MKLNGIKGIALLGLAALLLVGSMAAIAAAGAEDRSFREGFRSDEGWRMDARYWWEFVDPEYRDDAIALARRNIPETLRHYWQFAEKRGFEVPSGIPHPDEDLDIMRLTQEEFELVLNPPPPPLRLLSIEQMEAIPGVVAVYGRARTYNTQAEIRKWLDQLRIGQHSAHNIVGFDLTAIRKWLSKQVSVVVDLDFVKAQVGSRLVNHMGVRCGGYLSVGLNMDELTINEAQALASQIYVGISERAERLGIQDVPVVFSLTKIRLPIATIQIPEEVAAAGLPLAQPGYDVRYRPIPGGVEIKGIHRDGNSAGVGTTGFAVRYPIPRWWDDIDYIVTGHLGEAQTPGGPPHPTHVSMPIYQPAALWRTHGAGTVEEVTRVRSLPGGLGAMADVARVAIHNWHVTPYIHAGGGTKIAVRSYGHAHKGNIIEMSGRASGRQQGTVLATVWAIAHPTFIQLFHQSIASFNAIDTDSGAPIFRDVAGGVEVLGIVWGEDYWYQGDWRAVFSPISGIKLELPGWEPHTK